MKITYVTSMNVDVFLKFGWRLLKTFEEFNHENDKLYIYTEEKKLENIIQDFNFKNIYVKHFKKDLFAFVKKFNSNRYNGKSGNINLKNLKFFVKTFLKKRKFNLGIFKYNFLNDVIRFSYKSFAMCDALKDFTNDVIFYVDADCNIFNNIPKTKILRSLSGNSIGYFGRDTYTETGIIIFDNRKNKLFNFEKVFRGIYTSGSFIKLPHYTDCHIFDEARRLTNDEYTNLNKYYCNNHPIARSWFSEFIDHRKGGRKSLQKSPEINKNV